MSQNQTSNVAMGFLIGLGLGAVAGLFLAPQSGKESQEWLAERAKTGVENLKAARQRVKDGVQNFTVTLAVAKPWHVYANPTLGKDNAENATVIEVSIDGKSVEAKLDYPAGVVQKDLGGEYRIYTGTTAIRGSVQGAGKLSVRAKIVACNDKTCLLPSTLKAEAK